MLQRLVHAFLALVLLGVEVLIALYAKDGFVRPYLGDVLAVMLVYCVFRTVGLSIIDAAIAALAVALVIEISQLSDLIDTLGLGQNRIVRIVLGGAFDWFDLAAYGAGAGIAALLDTILSRRR